MVGPAEASHAVHWSLIRFLCFASDHAAWNFVNSRFSGARFPLFACSGTAIESNPRVIDPRNPTYRCLDFKGAIGKPLLGGVPIFSRTTVGHPAIRRGVCMCELSAVRIIGDANHRDSTELNLTSGSEVLEYHQNSDRRIENE